MKTVSEDRVVRFGAYATKSKMSTREDECAMSRGQHVPTYFPSAAHRLRKLAHKRDSKPPLAERALRRPLTPALWALFYNLSHTVQ